MKKLKLSLANMEGAELLSREQLKKVTGGEGSGTNPCEGKSTFEGYCRNSQGTLLDTVTPDSCSGQDLDSACTNSAGYRRANSSCSCW